MIRPVEPSGSRGSDLRAATLSRSLPASVWSPQESHLFHDTIRANLDYAVRPGVPEAEMLAALTAAQILPLIERLPEGLDTVVGDRGYRLSGGEKQRMALAASFSKAQACSSSTRRRPTSTVVRVAVRATSSLRSPGERRHRPPALDHSSPDQILVVDGGRIVERGRHHELLALGGCMPISIAPSSPTPKRPCRRRRDRIPRRRS